MIEDKDAIRYVLGSLINRPSLATDMTHYSFSPNDFSNSFYRMIYKSIANVINGGGKECSIEEVYSDICSNAVRKESFDKQDGLNYLKDCVAYANPDNFVYYYNRLKKVSLLNDLQNHGYDITDIYDENSFDNSYLEKFEAMSISDIVTHYRKKFNSIEKRYTVGDSVKQIYAADGIAQLLKELNAAPEVGIPLQGDIFNTVVRGGRQGKFYLRSAGSGTGKAIPNYTLIPTPIGWRRVGDIQAGDYLFGRDGKPTKVLQIHPQPTEKEIYNVRFSDGRIAECCEDHLWQYYYESHKGWESRTESVKEILNRANNFLEKFTINGDYRYKIDINSPVEYQPKNYSISPYTMGTILGDVYVRDHSSNEALPLSAKFIPEDYLLGSIKQRYELLQGLLDTVGTIDSKGRGSLTTTSTNLKDNVVELCHSLGMIATVNEDEYTTEVCYNISIQMRIEDTDKLSIVDIYPTGKYAEMTCFTVDNDEHLFLMNDYIVTHNTRSMVGDACICAYPIRYDSMTEKWVNYGSNEKVLFITTEQTPDEIQTMVLAYLSNVNEEKILFSHYSGDEWQRVQQAIKVMEAFSDNLLIIQLPDPNIEQIKSLIRTTIIENDIYIVFYDYIFSSPSLLGEFRDLKIREDVVLNLLSTALKDVAVETNCFLMSATQINAEGKQKKEGVHDEGSLRGSRAIADKVDIGAVLSVVAPEDMPLFESLGVIPNQVLDIYKVRRGRYTRVKIWINSDLGTCRRNDLFITDANLNPLTDFEKADFMHWSSDESITSLINALNNDSLEDDDGNTF